MKDLRLEVREPDAVAIAICSLHFYTEKNKIMLEKKCMHACNDGGFSSLGSEVYKGLKTVLKAIRFGYKHYPDTYTWVAEEFSKVFGIGVDKILKIKK